MTFNIFLRKHPETTIFTQLSNSSGKDGVSWNRIHDYEAASKLPISWDYLAKRLRNAQEIKIYVYLTGEIIINYLIGYKIHCLYYE